MRQKDYQVFTRPFELNLIGIRSESASAYRFEESLIVLFYDDFEDALMASFACATKVNALGNAPMQEGQYIRIFERCKTSNKDYALRTKGMKSAFEGQLGMRSEVNPQFMQLRSIECLDGSCLVLRSGTHILCTLLDLSIRHYGNCFSYTLLNLKDFQ